MSLKAFHIAFITLSIVLALGFAVWMGLGYAHSGDPLSLLSALLSVMAAVGLVFYSFRFLRKMKGVSLL